ncbi:MAG TPA: nuclear transport factor 2 family protein [Dongiaceae bacterium]|nr:nuclear transport factor 2 family protein [Dongiaceae bacterium]
MTPARGDRLAAWLAAGAILAIAAPPGWAEASDQAAIRQALAAWTADFNAGRPGRICDLFSAELRYDFRGVPERGYQAMCEGLRRALADPSRKITYSFDIKEILVFGDTAIVRLVWTARVTRPGIAADALSHEPGLDVFRRQPDGGWKIIRYMAYEE